MAVREGPGGPATRRAAPRSPCCGRRIRRAIGLHAPPGEDPLFRARPARVPRPCTRATNSDGKAAIVVIEIRRLPHSRRGGVAGLSAASRHATSLQPRLSACSGRTGVLRCFRDGVLPPLGPLGYNARVLVGQSESGEAEAVLVTLNGERRRLPSPISLGGLLDRLGLDFDAVAIERNRVIVRRPHWPTTRLEDGDKVEVVHFVGGG